VIVEPAFPAGFSLDVVLTLQPGRRDTRLRLDGGGRPYLVTKDTFVPLQRLASGDAAKAFKVAQADPIGDVAWMEEGVMLIVVGNKLGVIGERGFVPILDLPMSGMRVVAATTERCWLFAPETEGEGRLYVYAKAGTVTELLRAPAAIRAVSGTPDRAYLAVNGSLMRIAGANAELVFDGPEPIVALGAIAAGVFFSTKSGTFFLSNRNEVSRLTKDGALAIETHGDEVFLHLDALGIVRGAPVSAFAGK
jgi:hypothetical protein